ncbi:MAG: hypothetical protein REJ50_23840 [Bordetella sp.]|nr:hypothetical protein [Bordetella sp.]
MLSNVTAISVDTAVLVTGISKRTLWRRIAQGQLVKLGEDTRGRARVCIKELAQLSRAFWSPDEVAMFVDADAGDAMAKADLGAALYLQSRLRDAFRLFLDAAEAGSADAAHWLASCYSHGHGTARDDEAALFWLERAALRRHPIAREQLRQLSATCQGDAVHAG